MRLNILFILVQKWKLEQFSISQILRKYSYPLLPFNIIKNRSVTLLPNQYRLFHIINYEFYLFCIFPYYFCHKPKQHVIKKILLILIAAQFIIAPQIIKGSGANNSHEYIEVNPKKRKLSRKTFWEILLSRMIKVIRKPLKKIYLII